MSREWFRRVFGDDAPPIRVDKTKPHSVEIEIGEAVPEGETSLEYPLGFDSIRVGRPEIEESEPRPRRRR
jgi:hypothetical protein